MANFSIKGYKNIMAKPILKLNKSRQTKKMSIIKAQFVKKSHKQINFRRLCKPKILKNTQ